MLLIFCLFPLLLSQATNSEDLRGVAPENIGLYQGKDQFNCADNSKQYPISFVNDDYCDCEDGSDEPGTSACEKGRFSCHNTGWKRATIISSRVNDGICDCCDGSDEYASGVKCPSNCEELKMAETKHIHQAIAEIEAGLEEKARMIAKAEGIRQEKLEEIERLKKEIEEQNLIVEQKLKEKEEKEEKEKVEKERRRLENERRTKEKEAAEKGEVVGEGDAASEGGDVPPEGSDATSEGGDEKGTQELPGVESIDVHSGVIVDDNSGEKDDTEKEAFPYPEEYAYREETADVNDDHQHDDCTEESCGDENKEDFPYPEEYAYHKDLQDSLEDDGDAELDELMDLYGEEEYYEDYEFDESDGDVSDDSNDDDIDYEKWYNYKEAEATEARNQYNTENRKKTDLEKDLEKAEKFMEHDFGPDLEFVALYGNCYTKTVAKYTYEFCGFDQAHQKEGSSKTDLGKFESWKPDSPKRVMQFRNGQKCWQGPNRSLDVEFSCGPINEIISVSEPSKCVYEMQFKTPSACTQEDFTRLKQELHDITSQRDEL